MKKQTKRLWFAGGILAAFGAWTAAVRFTDVAPIGPEGSTVGFGLINGYFHNLTGVHMALYQLTDWLGIVPLCFVAGFALLGLIQWIRRKKLSKVDRSLLVLGGFYIVVMGAYGLFEVVAVNYRPVLIDGVLEASYPSSTTMLVMCVIPTAIMQLRDRIHKPVLMWCVICAMAIFAAFMVVGRLVSGVHWLTDIVGSLLLSWGLVQLYRAIV